MPVNELINASLYVIAIIVYWRKARIIDAYFILMFAFAFTAVISMFYEASGMSSYHTTLFPYFYAFFCIWLCFKPFQSFNISSTLYIRETWLIKLLMWIYIVAGVLDIIYTLPNAMAIMAAGDYGSLRTAVYTENNIVLYTSQFERLCKNIHTYLSPFGVVITFYQLIKADKNWFMIILMFGIWVLSSFLSATLTASRGMVVALVLQLLLIYFIFRPIIPAKVQKVFYFIFTSCCIPVFLYLIAVTVSRFGEYGANDSVFMYLGHAMQNLNENCIGSMQHFAWGKYALSYFSGINFSTNEMAQLGYTGGTGFYTFLGAFYIDYGPIGTIFFCLLLNRVLGHFTQKQNLVFSDLVVLVFFASFFMNGVFVVGLGYAITWIMLVVIYLIVYFTE